MIDTCYVGDVRDGLRAFLAAGIRAQTCVTSPPYWGLRDYGTAQWDGGDAGCDHKQTVARHDGGRVNVDGFNGSARADSDKGAMNYRGTCNKCGARRVDRQLGLEPAPAEYVANMVEVFGLVRDVLADDGTLWLNIGDSYANVSGGAISAPGKTLNVASPRMRDMARFAGLKTKDLVGIPWRLAFALQADGWVLRSEIIWSKPNPMPESVTDRPTKAHEQFFLFAKAKWIGPERGRFAHISDADARWIALCIDTEGCIVVKRCKQNDGGADTFAPQVTFGGTSTALVERFRDIIGHGNIATRSGKNAPMHYWQAANNVARDLLYRIYPHLIVKQRQAAISIHVDSLTYHRGGRTSDRKARTAKENDVLLSLWARNKQCNQFGDPDLSDVPVPDYGRWDSQPYYYDAAAVAEQALSAGQEMKTADGWDTAEGAHGTIHRSGREKGQKHGAIQSETRNKRTVWTIATQPYAEAHFAVMPRALVEPCILAGSRVGDVVLDPFLGSGTVAQVAQDLGRRWIGCELNESYVAMQGKRTAQQSFVLAAD